MENPIAEKSPAEQVAWLHPKFVECVKQHFPEWEVMSDKDKIRLANFGEAWIRKNYIGHVSAVFVKE